MKTMTLKWLGVLALAGLVLVSFWGCTRTPGQAEDPVPRETTPVVDENSTVNQNAALDPRLIEAQNRFGFQLLTQLQPQAPTENLVISPLSISMALSMTQSGAAGDTLGAMQKTLNLEGMEVAAVNNAIATQIAALEAADSSSQLTLANSLWARDGGISLNPEFVQAAESSYQAEARVLDFNNPSALKTINDWVSKATAGKISSILDQINSNDVLFLINAVYFKGAWETPFEPEMTTEEPFSLPDGTSANRALMSRSGDFSYTETGDFQAVRLPYGNGRLGMVVLLPKAGKTATVQSQLTADTWKQWNQQLSKRPGTLKLPKFKLEYSSDLNDPLAALGMEIAFDPERADFGRLSEAQTFISEVKHKTFIEVNEAGTEAAGSTSVGISVTSMPIEPPQPFEMVVNRPFFLVIEDQVSSSILFLGWVMNPTP